MIRAALIGAFCTLPLTLAAQRGPVRDPASMTSIAGTGSIAGKVMTDETPARPVRRATIRLGGADLRVSQVTVTDDAGEFTFAGLAASRYLITAARPGFISAAFGAKRPEGAGSAITLTEGQHVSGLTIAMLRGAVITGVVRDEQGNPASNQTITVMRYGFSSSGQRTLTRAGSGVLQTDDRGVYRVFGLPPSEYLIVATPGFGPLGGSDAHQMTDADVQWALRAVRDAGRGGGEAAAPPPSAPNVVYAPVFYPGTSTESSAGRIQLRAGEERSGVDIPLTLVPAAMISGHVTSADGQVAANSRVSLLAHERIEGVVFSGFQASSVMPDGTYRFTGVTPGTYSVAVRMNPPPVDPRGGGTPAPVPPSLYGLADVSMDGHDQTVDLALSTGATVSGRVVFDGAIPRPSDLTKISIALISVLGTNGVAIAAPSAVVDAAGAFTFTGVAPGRYRVDAAVPGTPAGTGWRTRSSMLNGRDTLDLPFEVSADDVPGVTVTLTDHPAELSGTIQDAAGQPTPEYFVIVFPRDQTYWTPQSRRIQAKRPSSDGHFTFPNEPPGDYLVAAVTDVEQGEWYAPTFLTELSQSAIPVTIAEGEKKVQNIRVGR